MTRKSLKKWATLTLSLLGVLVFSGCWFINYCETKRCIYPSDSTETFYLTIEGSSATNDYTITTRGFPNSGREDDMKKELIRGINPFRITIFQFPIRWDMDADSFKPDYSIPALAKTNVYFEVDNPNANALNIRVLPIVVNLTNRSLNQNYYIFEGGLYQGAYWATMLALTRHLGIDQEVCYFPDVRIEIAAETNAVVDLPITNDVAGNGYYCYAAPVNSFELKY